MLNNQTIEKLYDMKLNGMAEAFKEQLGQPGMDDLSFEERFALLVDRQWTYKEDRRMKRLLKNAKLKINASIEGNRKNNPIFPSITLPVILTPQIQAMEEKDDRRKKQITYSKAKELACSY